MEDEDDINQTRTKLLDAINKGCRDFQKLSNENAIDILITFIDEYRSESKMYMAIKDFLTYEDRNLKLLKHKLALAVLDDDDIYNELDPMFEEAYAEYTDELTNEFYDE